MRPVLCRPFIGRGEELAYLRERRREAASSHGGLVLLAGDAGVGKSRLIAEFSDSLAQSRWLLAHGPCLEFVRRPYGPILDALAKLDPGVPSPATPATKQEYYDAIAERVASIAARHATVVVIEDVHWADTASLNLLAYLGVRIQRMRVLIVVSFRPDELHPDHPATTGIAKMARSGRAGRIDLRPLVGSELRAFIDGALGTAPLPAQTRREIAIAGEGNPFFTEELLKSAVERAVGRAAERGGRELPADVRSTLLERLRPFSEDERRVLAQAAVIGRSFGVDLLVATLNAEKETVLATLRRARDFQLVEETAFDAFRFRHGLTRDAIYDDFLASQRVPLHRTIAFALERASDERPSLEALAYHWWAAGDAQRWAHYNELAGDSAGRVHAHEDAIAFYERAGEAPVLDPIGRGSLLEKIAEHRISLVQTEEALASYDQAANCFGAAQAYEREAQNRLLAALAAYTLGDSDPSAALERMLERLPPDDHRSRASAYLGLAWLAASFGFPSKARTYLGHVDTRALAEAGDLAYRFHNVAAWAAMMCGDLAEFRRESTAWLDAAHASESSRVKAGAYVNAGSCFAWLGLHDEAIALFERSLAIARESKMLLGEEGALVSLAEEYLMRGDLARAREAVERVSPTSDNHVTKTTATAWASMIAAHLDDRAMIAKWFDAFDQPHAARTEIEYGAGFAELLVRRGRERDAADLLRRAIPDCEFVRGGVLTLLAVARYGAAAERERARIFLVRASATEAPVVEKPAVDLFDAFVCSRAGKTQEALPLARRAADGFARLGYPLLEAAALELAGDPQAALTLYRRCGAAYEVRRLGGGQTGVVDAFLTQVPADALSSREREIARLAALGQTNTEIAKALSISPKTVEKHLGSAFEKLGVASRRELREFAAAPR